jgi:hypothetical protein
MVEVTMGVYRHHDIKAELLDNGATVVVLSLRHVTCIYYDCLLSVVPNKVGILPKWVKYKTFDIHNFAMFYSMTAFTVMRFVPLLAVENTCITR